MHLLLPDSIPDAHFVGTESRRMHLDAVASNPMNDEVFRKMYKELGAKVAVFGVFIGPKRSDFLLGDEGNLKYVDDFGLPEDPKPIEAAISKKRPEGARARTEICQ